MRVLSVVIALFLLAGAATAQAPSAEPSATLAQLMRAIFFPNSNILFDVQSRDPDAPPEEQGRETVSATFSSIYTGWPVVEHAALAIAEAANLPDAGGTDVRERQAGPPRQRRLGRARRRAARRRTQGRRGGADPGISTR